MMTIKQRLVGEELVRTFVAGRVFHPIVVELFGMVGGYHGFWIDAEHVGLTTRDIIAARQAGQAAGLDCFVRVPPAGYWLVTQCLECGVGGVMGAQIHSTEEAEQFVQWAKFAPRGSRGLNVGGRDADYAGKPLAQFVEDANRDNLVAIQIETAGAVEDALEIAALDGVDLLFIGPADLSLALGVVGQFHDERLWEAIEKVAEASREHGKAWGALAPDPEFARKARDRGARLLTMGTDVAALRKGIQATQNAFADLF